MKAKHGTKLREMQEELKKGPRVCDGCSSLRQLTVDHIVPVHFIEMLGLKYESINDDWNFEALCHACQHRKNMRLDFTNPKTIPNLRRYIDLAESFYGER